MGRFIKFIPFTLKRLINNFFVKHKYGVKLGSGADTRRSSFEVQCTLGQGTKLICSKVGTCTYVANNCEISKADIGRFCSLGDNIRIGLGRHPSDTFVSTSPLFYSPTTPLGKGFPQHPLFADHLFVDEKSNYHVKIENDVWIGNNVSIMDGITIGNGAIVATGAIVTKDIAPYSIVAGVPAKVIKMRFSLEEINFLSDFKWWNKDMAWIRKNHSKFSKIQQFMKN